MRNITIHIRKLAGVLWLMTCIAALWPFSVAAQPVFNPGATYQAQRNVLNSVRSQVNWLQNSTRTASNFGEQGYGSVWRSFQELRLSFAELTQTLTPQQTRNGANDLAELNAGLDILQEAFDNYRDDIAAGHSSHAALARMCQAMRQGSALWLQELNKTSSRLGIGRG